MDRKKIQLNRVFTMDHYCLGSTAGFGRGITEIYITDDGHGLTGYYDRVHVLFEDGRHLIFPAHHCKEWELINVSKGSDDE